MKLDVKKIQLTTLFLFIVIITALAWQSDDSYHAYVMAKHLVEGNGFVYNIGERVSASSCPLFTLIIAAGYFFIRNMFIVSLLICVVFSGVAYYILSRYFCKTGKQILICFAILLASVCFISYTASGLENCLLYLLSAIFIKKCFDTDTYNGKALFQLALLFSLIAMTRMDAVLIFIPIIVYIYLMKRENVTFIKAVLIGMAGLLPFFLWEVFSLIYYGFPVPNTAYVKLGTEIPMLEYIKRGIQYYLVTALNDISVLLIPFAYVVIAIISKNIKHILTAAGIILYGLYVLRIGGDFMLGRHFTVLFFIALCGYMILENNELTNIVNMKKIKTYFTGIVIACIIYTCAIPGVIGSQFLYGSTFYSPIADERSGYFANTSLFNNMIQYLKDGTMVIRSAWNEEGIDELRSQGKNAGILKMVPGISIYYNSDMYLNDMYALGDPFLSKLPAIREESWRIGHMQRDIPAGYIETVQKGENLIVNKDLKEYYDKIYMITRGKILDKERLQTIVNMNLGRYDYLIENYKKTLDENYKQIEIED